MPGIETNGVDNDNIGASSVVSSLHNYVVPFVADMGTSGTASLVGTALARKTVTIAGIQHTFYANLSNANSIKLLNSFVVSDPDGNTDNLVVSLADRQSEFHDVLMNAIIDASDNSQVYIPDWLNSKLSYSLITTILNTLRVSVTPSSSVTIDASGAAYNVQHEFSDAYAEELYLQIDQDTLNSYRDSQAESSTTALPLKPGDKLTFVFDTDAITINANFTNATL